MYLEIIPVIFLGPRFLSFLYLNDGPNDDRSYFQNFFSLSISLITAWDSFISCIMLSSFSCISFHSWAYSLLVSFYFHGYLHEPSFSYSFSFYWKPEWKGKMRMKITDASQLYAGSSSYFLLFFLFAFIIIRANKREENDDERSVS